MRGKVFLEVFPGVRVWSQTTLQASQGRPKQANLGKSDPWSPPVEEAGR